MKTKSSLSFQRKQLIFYLAVFVSAAALAFLFSPSSDDFGWATTKGLLLFKRGFSNYNGRYLGNIFALSLTRIPLLLPFIKSATLTLVVFILNKLTANKSIISSIFATILLLIPTSLFTQGFVWTAGFSNYYISALIIASSLYVLIFVEPQKTSTKILRILFLIVTGVAGQLYMETYTLFTLVVSACSVIVLSKKNHRIDFAAVIYFIACIAGAVIMFSNGVYGRILRKENTYQAIQTSSDSLFGTAITAIKNLFGEVSFNFLKGCLPAIIALCILLILLYRQNRPENKRICTAIKLSFLLCPLPAIAYVAAVIITKKVDSMWYLIGVTLLIFFGAVALTVISCAKQCAVKLAVYFAMVLVLCAPLSMVYPVGPRCYVGVYFILIMVLYELFAQIKFEEKPVAVKVASAALCIMFAFNFVCYSIVYTGQQRKIESAREQIARGETTIVFEHTPLYIFVYSLDTEDVSRNYTKRFCEYYGLPQDIKIVYSDK